MNYLISILIILFSFQVHALEGVVLVPKTALYLNESEQAEISGYRLQGNIIFLHGYHNTATNSLQFKNLDFPQTKFYKSIDRIGRPVYVRAEDVFIYYGDVRELQQLE